MFIDRVGCAQTVSVRGCQSSLIPCCCCFISDNVTCLFEVCSSRPGLSVRGRMPTCIHPRMLLCAGYFQLFRRPTVNSLASSCGGKSSCCNSRSMVVADAKRAENLVLSWPRSEPVSRRFQIRGKIALMVLNTLSRILLVNKDFSSSCFASSCVFC